MAAQDDRRGRGLTKRRADLRPGVITRVAPLPRDPERVSIHIDGHVALILPALVVLERGLREGVALDEHAVAQLGALAEIEDATTAALHFLGYRPRSEREVRDRLRQRGFGPEAIDAAVAKLHGWRYLDDRAFAEYWVGNRVEHAPRGRRRLEAELRAKGIDRASVADALDSAALGERDAALALARRRLPALAGLDEPTRRRRLAGYLARRGYDWEIVRSTLVVLFGEDDA